MKTRIALIAGLLGAAAGLRAQPLPPVVDPSAVDASADPCTDFYQYACGAWVKANPVPADQSRWFRFSELDRHTEEVLRSLLAEAAAERNQTSLVARKIGDFYAACMDEPAIDARGLEPLRPVLAAVEKARSKSELPGLAARLQALGAGPLFSFGSAQDYTDASTMIADADQGGFALPDRDYYLTDNYQDERRDYAAHLEKIFGLLGEKDKQAADDAGSVLRAETALAAASMGRVERREPKNVHHKMKLGELSALTPSFDWKRYLDAAGAPAFAELDVSDPGFFRGLEAALGKVSLDDWKTYLRWSAVHAIASALPSPIVREEYEFFGRRLSGQRELKPRWKRCVASADQNLGEALGQVYVEREFPPAAKARVLDMVGRIEAQMKSDVQGLPWMSAATQAKALEKLAGLANKIGYPDKWRDYGPLEIAAGDALGNLQRGQAFEFRRQLAKIGKPVDRGEWEMTPPTDNAYYDPQMNNINFPAGILQPPNFDLRADTAALYGSIGATIGHELTHGFDDEGRHYDAKGNLADWWTEADGKAFDEKAQGFVREYSDFVTVKDSSDAAKDVHLNGELTLGENIADNGGLLLAYLAFEDAMKGEKPAGLDGWTPQQRFFVSYGQSWCENVTEAAARKSAKVDPHSTGKYRVNGVIPNQPAFAQAFACKPGSPMAPAAINRVW